MGFSVAGLEGEGVEGDFGDKRLVCGAGGELPVVLEVVGEGLLVVFVKMSNDALFGCDIFGCLISHFGDIDVGWKLLRISLLLGQEGND